MNNQKSGFPEFNPGTNTSAVTPKPEGVNSVPSSDASISNFQTPQLGPSIAQEPVINKEAAGISVPIQESQSTPISVETLFPDPDTGSSQGPSKAERDNILRIATAHGK